MSEPVRDADRFDAEALASDDRTLAERVVAECEHYGLPTELPDAFSTLMRHIYANRDLVREVDQMTLKMMDQRAAGAAKVLREVSAAVTGLSVLADTREPDADDEDCGDPRTEAAYEQAAGIREAAARLVESMSGLSRDAADTDLRTLSVALDVPMPTRTSQ